MLDFIYDKELPDGVSELGKALFAVTTIGSSSLSVVHRREIIVSKLTQIVEQRAGAKTRALCVACGHLREADALQNLIADHTLEIVALDQDKESLSSVMSRHRADGVEALHMSIRNLLTSRADLGSFDAIWSSGLYDYLGTSSARMLTTRLLGMLRPKGTLILSNFTHSHYNRAYMEAAMDWRLILRNEEEMLNLVSGVSRESLCNVETFLDPFENIAFLSVQRE
ncbi:MAG: class I SAM-dependent methyltransferase [Bacteroidota bacterium]